jgi:hypothetical protein
MRVGGPVRKCNSHSRLTGNLNIVMMIMRNVQSRGLYIYSLALSYMRLLSKRYGLKENPKQFNCIDYSPKLYEYLI